MSVTTPPWFVINGNDDMGRRDHVAARKLSELALVRGASRFQGLIALAKAHPDHAPVWAELAHEHWNARRREEALSVARKALHLDPGVFDEFPTELKIACRPLLAQLRPRMSAQKPEPSEHKRNNVDAKPRKLDPVLQGFLDKALGIGHRQERLAVLEQLRDMEPDSPEILFHLAKEQAVMGRMDKARETGSRLHQLSSVLYTRLYEWAARYLAEEQEFARAQVSSSGAQNTHDEPDAIDSSDESAADVSESHEIYVQAPEIAGRLEAHDCVTRRVDVAEMERLAVASMVVDIES